MNRQQRRTTQREAKRARAAIIRALGPELAGEFELNAPGLLDSVATLVASGLYSPAAAAEAMSVCNDLADATVRGDITPGQGHELVEQHALRQCGKRRSH